jgi:hypothetical protein
MPGPAPARTPAKQSPAAPAAIPRTAAHMQAGKDTPPMPERQNSQEEHGSNSSGNIERYSKPHVIEKKKSPRAASNASR